MARSVWAYQFTPADNWDYDANPEMILADLTVKGRPRKALVHFDKNGFAYTLDRATGEVLVAEPYVPVNWAKRIDLTTGRPVLDSTKITGASKGNVKYICPSLEGGKNPAARGLLAADQAVLCARPTTSAWTTRRAKVSYIAGHAVHRRHARRTTPGAGGNMGAFIAWDAA